MSHPYEYHRFMFHLTPDLRGKSILDLGCGRGLWAYFIRSEKAYGNTVYIVGVDLAQEYLSFVKQFHVYDALILADVGHLPLRDKAFDLVLGVEVIEHLTEDGGRVFLNEAERVCGEMAIITTPNGFIWQGEAWGVRYEAHKSGWSVKDFKKRGYRVYGMGFRLDKYIKDSRVKGLFRYVFTPFSYIFPWMGEFLIAVKDVRKRK